MDGIVVEIAVNENDVSSISLIAVVTKFANGTPVNPNITLAVFNYTSDQPFYAVASYIINYNASGERIGRAYTVRKPNLTELTVFVPGLHVFTFDAEKGSYLLHVYSEYMGSRTAAAKFFTVGGSDKEIADTLNKLQASVKAVYDTLVITVVMFWVVLLVREVLMVLDRKK